jgi:RNA polymerase sigma-70 factor (ECF subfamily)
LRYFTVVAAAAAEDLASETWLGVVRAIGRFRGSEPAFRAWVFTIARHKALDWRRHAARRPTEDPPAASVVDLAAPDDPAAAALEGFSTRAALALIGTLPADQAEAIMLRVVAGLEVDRVADIMGKRPGTVRVLTHRGLRRLAERLGADARIRGVTRWAPTTLRLLT